MDTIKYKLFQGTPLKITQCVFLRGVLFFERKEMFREYIANCRS